MKSLWIDNTLLSEWAEVIAIAELCPDLEWLSVSKNRLRPLTLGSPLPPPRNLPMPSADAARIALAPFQSKLRTLALNDTMTRWSDILVLDAGGHFPNLEHLHLARNRLTEGLPSDELLVSQSKKPLPNLKSLVLDGNDIKDWRVLKRAVTCFPSLEVLHLNQNLLGSCMDGLEEMATDATERRLTSLSLNDNQLSTWIAVTALAGYSLLELKLQRNPISEGPQPVASPQVVRQMLIAMMPTLMRLNSSEVPQKERMIAERYFLALSQQGNAVTKALQESVHFAGHLARLIALHGEVVGGADTEEAQATRSALVNCLCEVVLQPVGAAILEQAPIQKRVPHTMTVSELKQLCHSLFKKVPLARMQLLLADPGLPWAVPFEDESRELGFYGVTDGAQIRVDDTADAR